MIKPTLIGTNLSLGYSNGKKNRAEILKGLNFELQPSQLTCLLGPNGVGKSTLVKAMMGLLEPWEGEITLDGKNIRSYSQLELAKTRAVVLTESFPSGNMTVAQLVALGRIPHTGWTGKLEDADREAVEKALDATKIQYLRDERLGEISDGQRQKAMIARALAQEGRLLILDEPTAHLDLVNRFEIMHLLREIARNQDKTILVVTHDLEIALETADQFWILNCGSPLLAGMPEQLVVSGQINQLLPSDRFYFDLERGRISEKTQPSNLIIEGKESTVFWVKKALLKAGIIASKSNLRVFEDPFSVQIDEDIKVENLSKLVQILQNSDQSS
jgi:iron complex transport system ATP-binding protein